MKGTILFIFCSVCVSVIAIALLCTLGPFFAQQHNVYLKQSWFVAAEAFANGLVDVVAQRIEVVKFIALAVSLKPSGAFGEARKRVLRFYQFHRLICPGCDLTCS